MRILFGLVLSKRFFHQIFVGYGKEISDIIGCIVRVLFVADENAGAESSMEVPKKKIYRLCHRGHGKIQY